jgi:hypothetical protein
MGAQSAGRRRAQTEMSTETVERGNLSAGAENYFTYFSEIEDHFQRRRGTGLLLSTLDWALIETWKDAGIPLEAVLRGIDATFDRYERRPRSSHKINSLAYCSQEVLAAAEDMKEAAVGVPSRAQGESGLDSASVAAFLVRNAEQLERAAIADGARSTLNDVARTLRETAAGVVGVSSARLEDLERLLTALEEKLLAVLLTSTPDDVIVAIRAEADRDLAPYRSKMIAAQIEQLHRQYLHKRLLESAHLPRLSMFYM